MTFTRRLFGAATFGFVIAGVSQARAATDKSLWGKGKAAASPLTVSPRSPFLSYEGRTANMADGTVRAGFPGVVLRINVTAAKLTLKTSGTSETVYLDVAVDGGEPSVVILAKGAQDLVLFDGAHGDHNVEITRRTESWEGQWDILGAMVDAGTFRAATDLPVKKLMFIGDSITCGAACDVARDNPANDKRFDNAHKTYAKLLAKALNAQCHLVSYGGRGIMRDWQGIRDTSNAPQFYERAAPDEPMPLWNPADYVPDAIGIMLGTNDFNQGIPDQNEFTNTYVEFIEKVRRDAPMASILLIDSPIVIDGIVPKRTVLGDYLDDIVRRVGSSKVMHAPIAHYAGRPGNGHPIAEDHVGIAHELETVFRAALQA